jgi:endonuclease YncB( thermonuclease family)
MAINTEIALALLLLPIIIGPILPPAAGQNALSNITVSDLVGNVTESTEDVIDDSLSLPLESLEDLTGSSLVNASDVSDLVGNVTESTEDVIDDSLSLPLESLEDLTDSPLVGGADDTSSVEAGDTILINEVELNPRGNDEEWIELYNPTAVDINIGGFEIDPLFLNPLFQSPTIKLPPDAVIEAGGTYVIELDRTLLSNTGESLVLANATGDIKDRTPSLVDRSDDDRTWQRIPDGNNEWQFVEDTQGSLNDPDTSGTATPGNAEDTQGSLNDPNILSRILENALSESDVECLGSTGCFEGVVTRIADGDTIYVDVNGTEYKVDLALIEAPSGTEEMFIESTEFTRDLCLGSNVLIDQDDMQLTSDSAVIAVVYCSSSNLNNELLDNGYATLEAAQCAASEFADEPWANDNDC